MWFGSAIRRHLNPFFKHTVKLLTDVFAKCCPFPSIFHILLTNIFPWMAAVCTVHTHQGIARMNESSCRRILQYYSCYHHVFEPWSSYMEPLSACWPALAGSPSLTFYFGGLSSVLNQPYFKQNFVSIFGFLRGKSILAYSNRYRVHDGTISLSLLFRYNPENGGREGEVFLISGYVFRYWFTLNLWNKTYCGELPTPLVDGQTSLVYPINPVQYL